MSLSSRLADGSVGSPAAQLCAELLVRCRFPAGGGPMVAAVSGGPDSLALLILAVATGRSVVAIHVDHGIRAGSAVEADVVRSAAEELGAAFESRTVLVGEGGDLEARARRARYQALPVGVLTGHTADDQAETILLNLLRGAGLDGLAGMRISEARARVVRPLLGLRRAETHALCDAWGFVAVRDPSNSDLRFRRNRVRHQLVPVLESVAERDVVPILARQAALLADDAAYLDAAAAEIDPTDVRALAVAPRALARRALRRWLRHGVERHPPTAAEVERVLSVVDGTAAACEVNGGRRVRRSRGRLRLELPDSVGTAMETEIREPETGQPETRQRPHR